MVSKSIGRRLFFEHGNCDSYSVSRKPKQINPNWGAQEGFCRRVEGFAEREGLITPRGALMLEPLAAKFGLSPSSLKQFLQNKKRPRPHFDTLANIANVIGDGCDVMEFWEMPSQPPGVTKDRWAEASEQDKLLVISFLEALKGIPEEEKPRFSDLIILGMELRTGRIAAEKKAEVPVKRKTNLK